MVRVMMQKQSMNKQQRFTNTSNNEKIHIKYSASNVQPLTSKNKHDKDNNTVCHNNSSNSVEVLVDASNTGLNTVSYQYQKDSNTNENDEDAVIQQTHEIDNEIILSKKVEAHNNNNIRDIYNVSPLFTDDNTNDNHSEYNSDFHSIGTSTTNMYLTPNYTSAKKHKSSNTKHTESKKVCRQTDEEFAETKLASKQENSFHCDNNKNEGEHAAIGYAIDKVKPKLSSSSSSSSIPEITKNHVLVVVEYHGLGRGRTAIAPAWITRQQKKPQTSLIFPQSSKCINREASSSGTSHNHDETIFDNTTGSSSNVSVSDGNNTRITPYFGHGYSAVIPSWITQQKYERKSHIDLNRNTFAMHRSDLNEGGYAAIGYTLDERRSKSSSSTSSKPVTKKSAPVVCHGLGRGRTAIAPAWMTRQQNQPQTSLSFHQTSKNINREISSSTSCTTCNHHETMVNIVTGCGDSAVVPSGMTQQIYEKQHHVNSGRNKYSMDASNIVEGGYTAIVYSVDKTRAYSTSSIPIAKENVPVEYHGLGRGRTVIAPAWMTRQQKQSQASPIVPQSSKCINKETSSSSTTHYHDETMFNNAPGSIVSDTNNTDSIPSFRRKRSAVIPTGTNQQQNDKKCHVKQNMNKHATDVLDMVEGRYAAIGYSLDKTSAKSSSSTSPPPVTEESASVVCHGLGQAWITHQQKQPQTSILSSQTAKTIN